MRSKRSWIITEARPFHLCHRMRVVAKHWFIGVAWLLASPLSVLPAQIPVTIARGAAVITAAALHDVISRLADDSTMGRPTPSRWLDEAARYVGDQFRRDGLRGGGDDGTFLQRYPILERRIDTAASSLTFHGASVEVLKPGTAVNVLRLAPIPRHDLEGPVVLVTGALDSLPTLASADLRDAWVCVAVATKGGALPVPPWLPAAVRAAGSLGVVFVSDRPDVTWNGYLRWLGHAELVPGGGDPGPDTARGMGFVELRDADASRALGIATASLRSEGRARARLLPGLTLTYHVEETTRQAATAPNVVGILPGSDRELRSQYVVFTGHLDHLGTPGSREGCFANGEDSICNGADDDASGTAAVVVLARAFSRVSPRPKRSLVFLVTSGEERGHWGSRYFVRHPTAPPSQIVADLNADMIGRNARDSVSAIGMHFSDLGEAVAAASRAHPELHMAPVEDSAGAPRVFLGTDSYEFARARVPALFFFSGFHDDYHRVSDETARIDAEKTARITALEFYLGLALANAADRPHWIEARYPRLVGGR